MNRRTAALFVLVLLAPLVAACGGASNAGSSPGGTGPSPGGAQSSPAASTVSPTFALEGEVTIENTTNVQNLDNVHCSGRDGYSDLADGAPVVVRDDSGTVLAKTTLASRFERLGPESVKCHLVFSVDVPDGEKFYQVGIGARDPYVASTDEAKAGLDLTIG